MEQNSVLDELILRETLRSAERAHAQAETDLREHIIKRSLTEIEDAFVSLWEINDDWGRIFRRTKLWRSKRHYADATLDAVHSFGISQGGEGPRCYEFFNEITEFGRVNVTLVIKDEHYCEWDARSFLQAVANRIGRIILFARFKSNRFEPPAHVDEVSREAIVPQQFDYSE